MSREELDRLWRDPRCWSPIGIHRCPADPRVIVPKRARWAGWTLNFARPALTTLGSVTLLIALSAWEASGSRFIR